MSSPTVEAVRASFPTFVEFPSIPRLFRECVVTEKIDGTNASVTVNEDGTIWAASRTRYITPQSDNFGFAAWVKAHEDELREGLGVGQHFGEWFGSGIQRNYGLTTKRFALFNTARWGEVRPACCDVTPVIWSGVFDTRYISEAAAGLFAQGSLIVPGFMQPEGVVVFHSKSRQLYKYTFDKNDGHKSL